MAEERKDSTTVDNPLEGTNPVEETGNPNPNPVEPAEETTETGNKGKKGKEETTSGKTDDTKGPKKITNKGEGPKWWEAIKNFFKAIGRALATPKLFLEKLGIRIVGGKEAVKEAEKAFADAIKEQKEDMNLATVRERDQKSLDQVLEQSLKDPEYTQGAYITGVQLEKGQVGGVKYTAKITYMNEGELHTCDMDIDANDQLLRNATVPDFVQRNMAELWRDAQVIVRPDSADAHDDIDEQSGPDVPGDGQTPPVNPFQVINEADGKTVEVVRDPNDPEKATVTVTEGEREYNYTAHYNNGSISIMGMDRQGHAASALVAKSVYEAFEPLIKADHEKYAKTEGGDWYAAVAPDAFSRMRATVAGELAQAQESPDAFKAQGSHAAMFIIPAQDGTASVVRANITPSNLDKQDKKGNVKNDAIHMHVFKIDTTQPHDYSFVQAPGRKGKTETKFTDVALSPAMLTQQNALNAAMMQVQYSATGHGSISVAELDGSTTHLIAVANEQFERTGAAADIACITCAPKHEGFALYAEHALGNAELQNLIMNVPGVDDPNTTFSPETKADAVDILTEAQQAMAEGKQYTRYFVMGDTVMGYDGTNLTIQRPGDKEPFAYAADKLDAEVIESAQTDYRAQHAHDGVDEHAINGEEMDEVGDDTI